MEDKGQLHMQRQCHGLDFDMTQVVEILPQIRQGPNHST